MKNLIIVLGLCLFSAGCATVHVFQALNPEIPLKVYKKVLIIANVPGMEFQTQLEDGLTSKLEPSFQSKKFFQRSHLIFQVTPLTVKNIEELCEKCDCDAVIFIGVNPPTTQNYDINLGATTRGSVTPSAFGGYSFTSVTTDNSISGTISTFTATVDLVDIETGKVAWHSEETVSTGMFGSWDQAIDAFLQNVADVITQNNILREGVLGSS